MRGLAILVMVVSTDGAFASACRDATFEELSYTICTVRADDDLRLFLSGPNGAFGSFAAVNDQLEQRGEQLGFAMNAGMFHSDLAPVGLYVEDFTEVTPIVTREGPGNFGLLPNGVFCIADHDDPPKAHGRTPFAVLESRTFAAAAHLCRYATQSGPMMVIDGALHPKFVEDSDSLYIRNGVGVSADGRQASFVIANQPVNFHSFARFFRDALGLPNALYLDGSISRLYAPELNRHDGGFPMGPIVGTVVPKG